MKKTYRLENLDCANCAAKIENALKKLDGVSDASVSFMTQRMTLECDDSRLDDVLAKAKTVIRKLEPEVTVR
ncbi:MAG: heavy metal transporter [Clostridiales bacterium]|nr:heavy metal transporter [Clostridiales bacterium]